MAMKKVSLNFSLFVLIVTAFYFQSCKFIYHCPTYEAHYDIYRNEASRRKSTVIKSTSLKKKKKPTGKAEFPE